MTVSPLAVDSRAYRLGEELTLSVEVEFVNEDRELVDPPTELAGRLLSPTQESVELEVASDDGGETVTLTSVSTVTFAPAGVWLIVLTEPDAGELPPLPIVVEDRNTGWHTLASARRVDWPDAPDDDATLYELLQSAREQCIDYAPALPAGAPIPARWRQAQLKQARAIWTDLVSGGEPQGPEGIATVVYTMSIHVQQLLRPKRARPVIR